MRKIKYCSVLSLGLLCLLSTTGCHHKNNPAVAQIESEPLSLRDQIRAEGVHVVQQGSRLQLILPTDNFFRAQSTEIKANQTATLDLIALYLKSYLQSRPTQRTIIVAGYTDTVYSKEQRRLLSQQYAEVIASYLWNNGFSQQQLKAVGYGAADSIASTLTTQGSRYNGLHSNKGVLLHYSSLDGVTSFRGRPTLLGSPVLPRS